jgi:DNA polymerase-3 subunit gamma/tau
VQQSSAPLEAESVAHPTTSTHISGNGGQQQALAENMPPDIEPHPAGTLPTEAHPAEAHPGETTPADPPPQDVAAPSITSLADIATLAEAKDEMLLAARVRTHLRLVALHPGSLEVALTEKAPDSLIGDLAKYLTEWTGQRWLVSISDGPGGKTLAEERAEQADALKGEITETPLVKTILTLFPGSKIEAIKPSDAGSHNGNLHINAGNEPPMTDGENGE